MTPSTAAPSVWPGMFPDPDAPEMYRYWTGASWGRRLELPPGYYRRLPRGPRMHWDGMAWGRAYWVWWRRMLTAALVIVGVLLFLGALPAMLGDPGPGGATNDFERTKSLGASLEMVAMFGTPALLALLHVQLLRADRAWKMAARVARQPV